ncbi:MAG: DNA translocase FtsK 4TM domain-containing protein [Paracoccaceae bacterium]|nr:DNA translocase FtsK 4TM domain-containing protein [Paracoccaceae bacterium]
MVNQVQDRSSLFGLRIQRILQRRGQELVGILFLMFSLMWSFILLLSTYGSFFAKSIVDEALLNNIQVFSSGIVAPTMVTIGISSWILSIFTFFWAARLIFHLNAQTFFNRVVFLPILAAFLSVCASCFPVTTAWPHSFGLGGLFGDTILTFLVDVVSNSFGLGLKTIALPFIVVSFFTALFVLGFDKRELKIIIRIIFMIFLRLLRSVFKATTYICLNAVKFLFFRTGRNQKTIGSLDEENSDFKIERNNLAGNNNVLVEPNIKNVKISERFKTGEGLVAEGINRSIKADSLRSKISEAIKSRTLKINDRNIGKNSQVEVDQELEISNELPGDNRSFREALNLSKEYVAPKPLVVPAAARPQPSKAAIMEQQPSLDFSDKNIVFETPPLSLLSNPTEIIRHHLSDEALEENARMLENVLDDYGVRGDIVSVRPGPVVTMYELEPAPGLKASRVIGLSEDIARSMSALSARVSTLPGRSVIGIELPNAQREKVVLREILAARDYGDSNVKLPLALGKDIGGEAIVTNLSKMPHLLIAGTTGSGKSVAINTMILSLLYKLTPDDCRLIMIDPKMLELSVYDGIPHLLSPVVTDPKKAVVALKWVVGEMEERYRKMSKMGVRNIEGYNSRIKETLDKGEMFTRTVQTGFDDQTGEPIFETEEFLPTKLPFIVVVVDEMADLMMVAGKEIEACIQRLAQMARASGIHLIMATQRPSVDVITGTIKANFPTRISFQVTSKIDSRTILGEQGAEQLLGMGDMLYMAGGGKIIRVHAPFVSDEEVEEVVNHLKAFGPPVYVNGVVEGNPTDKDSAIDQVLGLSTGSDGEDAEYDQAVAILLKDRKCSTSYIQRKMAIGYNKAARLVERMEEEGLVSQANHVGKRIVLVPEQNS